MADPPKDLLDAIAEGRCLIVCGAGVSLLATDNAAPSWAKLINLGLEHAKPKSGPEPAWVRACAEQLKPDAATDDWLQAADTIQEKLGGHGGGRYRAFLHEAVGKLKATKTAVIEALNTLGQWNNRIATTNYDNLLCHGLKRQPVNWRDANSVVECLNGDHDAVLHLHGHWRDAASVVFSNSDYERLRSAESAQFLQQLATHNFTLLFVGCSNAGLADENVGALLDWFDDEWAGIGKKHFVLVREPDLGLGWPDAVTAISYGKHYKGLPDFLGKLAPAPSRQRAPFPSDPRMIGRGEQLKEVVNFILTGDRPIIVPGGPGMGKTTLALAAAHDKQVRGKFGDARVFVDLQAVKSADAMLRALASNLGVDTAGSVASILAGLGEHTDRTQTLAILDNLETPWNAEPIPTEEMLSQVAEVSGLRLVPTVRGETPQISGGACRLGDVERMESGDASKLFLRDAGNQFARDKDLSALLAVLDGHPLSIRLMAAQADGRRQLAGLVEDWNKRRAAVLARGPANDRLTSVRVSLGLSLDRLKADTKRLLGLVAMLPAGLQEKDLTALLPDASAADTVAALIKARLVETRDGRLTMLAPLRETAREEKLATAADEARLVRHFLAIAGDGNRIGTKEWQSVREWVTREASNLDAMCLAALDRTEVNEADIKALVRPLRGLAELHRFGVPAEVRSLYRALALAGTDATLNLKADCIQSLGNIALRRSDHEAARARYEQARPLYERVGDLLGQANCISSLGDIALSRSDHDTARARYEEAKPLFERLGSLLGQANCIQRLGDIALERSDNDTARARYEEAKHLYESVGELLGQGACIARLG